MTRSEIVVSAVGTCLPSNRADRGWFDQRTELGRGYRYLPPSAHYAIAATNRALHRHHPVVPTSRRGVVIGTETGTSGLHAEIDRAVLDDRAAELSPVRVPYFSHNLVGSRLAAEYESTGFSMSMHTPRTAALEAISVGIRSLQLGRIDWLLASGTESDTGSAAGPTVDEGAITVVLERADSCRRRGGTALGTLDVRTLFVPPESMHTKQSVTDALGRITATLSSMNHHGPVHIVGANSPLGQLVSESLSDAHDHTGNDVGSVDALRRTVDAMTTTHERIAVLALSPTGNVALASIVPDGRGRSSI